MYKVIEPFVDLQDGNYAYGVGDVFPRKGFYVSEERLAELSTTANIRGIVLIKEVDDEKKKPKKQAKKKDIKEK